VPAYRLSATSKLPANPRWLRDGGPCSNRCWRRSRRLNWSSICDRSYAALGRLPGAVKVEVLAEHSAGGAPW
jgi:hypothetical protein